MAHVHNLIMVERANWMTRKQHKAAWARHKFDKKRGYTDNRFNFDPNDNFRDTSAPWLDGITYMGPSRDTQIQDRWRRARDDRGWKARLSDNARARRAQILWRFRNSHLYSYAPRAAVNKFLRLDAERRRELAIGRGVEHTFHGSPLRIPKGLTFESPYIKPKNYRP
jgi:hypothetical protein